VNQLISNIIADIIDYLYGFIIPLSSELDRLQKGTYHPKAGDKPIPEVDSTIPESRRQTPKLGPKRGPVSLQTESHFTGDPCHRVWNQLGVPTESPRPCR